MKLAEGLYQIIPVNTDNPFDEAEEDHLIFNLLGHIDQSVIQLLCSHIDVPLTKALGELLAKEMARIVGLPLEAYINDDLILGFREPKTKEPLVKRMHSRYCCWIYCFL